MSPEPDYGAYDAILFEWPMPQRRWIGDDSRHDYGFPEEWVEKKKEWEAQGDAARTVVEELIDELAAKHEKLVELTDTKWVNVYPQLKKLAPEKAWRKGYEEARKSAGLASGELLPAISVLESDSFFKGDAEIVSAIEEVITLEVKAVADYKQGSQKAMNYLVGKCLMKLNRRAHPNTVREALESKLEQKDGKQG